MPSRVIPASMWQGFQADSLADETSGLLDTLRRSYEAATAPIAAAMPAMPSMPSLPDLDSLTSAWGEQEPASSSTGQSTGWQLPDLDRLTRGWGDDAPSVTHVDGRVPSQPRLQHGESMGDVQIAQGEPGDLRAWTISEARRLGIDPDIAVRVGESEGGFDNPVRQSDVVNNGVREQSYGPFQLYMNGGLGNAALAAGIDPRKPEHARAGITFALENAARGGWGPWHGAARVGIGNREGIGVAPPQAQRPTGPQPTTPTQAEQTPAAQAQAGGALDVQDVAQRYKGGSYVFGGGRDGQGGIPGAVNSDCSAFVSSVWREQGVPLVAHTDGAYNQLRQLGAPEVGVKDARAGDVVFYMGAGSGGAITHHMGIYAGDGKVLDQSVSGGGGVKLRDVGHGGKFVIIRDPRLNQEPARTANVPPPIVPTGIAEQTGGENLSRAEMARLSLNTGGANATPALPTPAGVSSAPAGTPPAPWANEQADGGLMLRGPLNEPMMDPGPEGAATPFAPPVRDSWAQDVPPPVVGPGDGGFAPTPMPTQVNPNLTQVNPGDGGFAPTPEPEPSPTYTYQNGGPPTPSAQWTPMGSLPEQVAVDPAEGGLRVPARYETVAEGPGQPLAGPTPPEQPGVMAGLMPVWDALGNVVGYVQQQAGAALDRMMEGPRAPQGEADRLLQQSARTVTQPVDAAFGSAAAGAEQAVGAPPGAARQAAEDVSNFLGPEQAVNAARTAVRTVPAIASEVRAGAEAAIEAVPAVARRAGEIATDAGRYVAGELMDMGSPIPRMADGGPGIGRALAEGAPAADARPAYSPTPPDGVQRRYHGTAGAFDEPDVSRFREDGLYGPGYYVTDNPDVAGAYAQFRAPSERRSIESLTDQADRVRAALASTDISPQMRTANEIALNNLEQRIEQLASGAGPNIRAIDIPPTAAIIDVDAPLDPALLPALQEVAATMRGPGRQMARELADIARDVSRLPDATNDAVVRRLFDAAERIPGMGKGLATGVLERAGYDGLSHTGGAVQTAAGPQQATHAATVIFPGKLDKITNAFSGEVGGATLGVSPGPRGASAGTRLATDAGNALAGSMMGAVAPADSDEERLRNTLLGAAGAPLLGRAIRSRGGALSSLVGPNAPAPRGRTARTPGTTFAFGAKPGEKLDFNVRVVPLSDLITSHNDNLAVNRAFPSELQPRVRERAASRVQIDRIVNEFDPDQLLVDTHTVDRGPMIVGPDLVVESGNGRSIALRRLAKENPEAYAQYVQALRDELPRYGLADDALEGIDQPVLVRERVTDVDRARFAAEANVGVQAEMSPIERAVQDAGRLTDDAVAKIAVGEGQSIDEALLSPENGAFQRAFMATVPDTERGALLDASGNLNAAGLERAKAALLVRTYTGAAGNRLATAFVESADPGIRNVEHGVMGSLPAMARAEARIASGEVDTGLSIASDVATAADVYSRLRRAGIGVGDYLAQMGMFEGRETTPLQDRILAYLNDNARAPRRIRALLDEYAGIIEAQRPSDAMDMFGGEVASATKEDLLDGVLRRLGAAPGADQGADLGRTGAGGQIVEGAAPRQIQVPEPGAGAQAGRNAGGDGNPSLIDEVAAAETLTPEQQIARLQAENDRLRAGQRQPRARQAPAPLRDANLPPVADDLIPATGGEAGTLAREGAPPPMARPGPVGDVLPATGGPEGVLAREGAPAPFERPTPLPDDAIPSTGGPEGTLSQQPGAPESVLRDFRERIRNPEKADEAAVQYQALVEAGASPEAIATFLKGAQDSRWWDRFDTLRYASMLSDPVTHGQNALGSVQLGAVDALERPLTALLDMGRARVTGGPREAFMSQVSAQVVGMAGAARQAFKDAAFIMAHGLRPEDLAKLDKRNRGFMTDIPGIAPRGSRAAGAVDFAMEGPLRALSAADALFRGTFRGGHLAAEATGAAIRANGGGRATPDEIKRFLTDPEVGRVAEERAAQAVLQEDRQITRAINSMRSRLPETAQAALSVAVPYIKTPYNIVAQGMGMTPAGLISLANDIRAGKPMRDRERRVSRMMLGAGVMAGASWENVQGLNTGGYPEDAAERSTLPPGWRPYSRKVDMLGETYYVPLALMGPVAIPAMLSILATEQYKKSGAFTPAMAAKIAEGVGQLAEDQTFLRSVSDFNEAISKGGNTAMNYLERQTSQFSPHVVGGGGIGRRIQAIMGEPSRDPDGVVEAWLATLPYTADQVPPRRDVIGREAVANPDGPAALVPIRAARENDAPVIAAFRAAGEGLPTQEPTQLTDARTRSVYPLSREQQERWRVEFGQELQQRWQRAGGTTDPKRLKDVEREARAAVNERLLRDARGGPVVPARR